MDHNIPIITVHDSAIVPVRHVQYLEMLMAEVYFEVVETGYFANSLPADGLTFSKALTDAIERSKNNEHVSSKHRDATTRH